MNSEILINKLMTYFNVFSMHELATKLDISQPAISKWKKNNSVIAIKKRCRELGIYDEIFGDAEFYQDHIYTSGRYYSEEEINRQKEQLEKNYDIEITTIKNKKLLNLFEILFRDCEINNKLEELEKDIKELILKYNPKIDKSTEDMFFEFLEKNRRNKS